MVLQRQLARAAIPAAGLALATYWVALLVGVDAYLVTHWTYLALLTLPALALIARPLLVAQDRVAWSVLAAGMTLWTFGSIYQVVGHMRGIIPAFPSVSDAFWLPAYSLLVAAFAILAWPWLRRAPRALALETAAVGFGLTALVTAAVVPLMTANAGLLSTPARIVNLTYPLADCALLSVAVIGAVVAGRQGGRTWALLGLGTLALAGADALWAAQASSGTWEPVMGSNALYPLWLGFAALAAWLPHRTRRRFDTGGLGTHAAALVAAVASVTLLVANEWLAVPAASVVLAALTLLVAVNGTGRALASGLRASFAAARERDLVEDVRDALDRGELDVYFQPLVAVASGRVTGAEALLRWRRPDGVFIPPDSFLPAVERSDLIGPLTDFVLDRALAAASGWHRSGRWIGVSVNLATANLAEADLPGRVLTALRRHDVHPQHLTLEITETATIQDGRMATHVLRGLRDLGVELSIDDFGTGHSSLIRLAHFPVSELKIDRAFVTDMHCADRPIVATAIQLAKTLGLRVVAEGVEDQRTLDALCELGCDIAQGYYISRPLPAVDLASWLSHPALV